MAGFCAGTRARVHSTDRSRGRGIESRGTAPRARILAAEPAPERGRCDAPEPNEWDLYQDFGHSHWPNSLIWGIGLEDVEAAALRAMDGQGNKAIALKLCRSVRLLGPERRLPEHHRLQLRLRALARLGNRGRGPGDPAPGRMRRIAITNVVASDVLMDAAGVHLEHVAATRAPGVPFAVLRDVRGLSVVDSPGLRDTRLERVGRGSLPSLEESRR